MITDEELVERIAAGPGGAGEEALRALHRRHAALVFTIAMRIVGAGAAEDVVQDVFLGLWRKHDKFDPARGTLKVWLGQLTRNAALNALRRRKGIADIDDIADPAPEPDEALWQAHRRSVLRAAVEALPPGQREALSLAYFDELTQEQVAATLSLPLGTAKTRIRAALRRLGPLVAAAIGTVAVFLWWRREIEERDRALAVVTSSDVVPIRVEAAPGIDPAMHGNYRARGATAVFTTSHLEPGIRYVAWLLYGEHWVSRTLSVRPDGTAIAVFQSNEVAGRPAEIQLTRESTTNDFAPRGPTLLIWRQP